jgi:hypothetical protein
MRTKGNRVICSVNEREVFSFTKGIRMVSNLSGRITEVIGLETKIINAEIEVNGKVYRLMVSPNEVYTFNGGFRKTRGIGFYR